MTEKQKTKVMVIEDDPTITQILITKLTSSGFDVKNTLNSTEAVFMAEQYQPDIFILDLMMTRLSGEEVVKAIKANDDLKNVPILVFSNKGVTDEIEYAKDMGVDRFLIKSDTSLSKLVEVVEEIVEGKEI